MKPSSMLTKNFTNFIKLIINIFDQGNELCSRVKKKTKQKIRRLDTYGWVEYFRKSPLSDKVESILEIEKMFNPNHTFKFS
jgi:hypothetical protein